MGRMMEIILSTPALDLEFVSGHIQPINPHQASRLGVEVERVGSVLIGNCVPIRRFVHEP